MSKNALLIASMLCLAILASGCLFESTEVTPDNLPKDQEGKTSSFRVTSLSKCTSLNMVFSFENTGDITIYFPIVFAGDVRCKTSPIVYPGKGYWVSCPHPDHPETLKGEFLDGKTYTVKIEAMTNTDTVTCDYSVWIPE